MSTRTPMFKRNRAVGKDSPPPRSPPNRYPHNRYEVQIHRASRKVLVSAARLKFVVRTVLEDEHVASAEIGLAIVGDEEIHRVNREHLDHDVPTDVISFLYSAESSATPPSGKPVRRGAGLAIEGELVISDETAAREAPRHKWPAPSELELYVVHGLLHLCGYDDLALGERRVMRRRERELIELIDQGR